MLLVTGCQSKNVSCFAWIWPNCDRLLVNHCAMPSIGQTWALVSIGAVVEMGVLSTLRRLLLESNPLSTGKLNFLSAPVSWAPGPWACCCNFTSVNLVLSDCSIWAVLYYSCLYWRSTRLPLHWLSLWSPIQNITRSHVTPRCFYSWEPRTYKPRVSIACFQPNMVLNQALDTVQSSTCKLCTSSIYNPAGIPA
jgi:hypothetical protein